MLLLLLSENSIHAQLRIMNDGREEELRNGKMQPTKIEYEKLIKILKNETMKKKHHPLKKKREWFFFLVRK